MTGSLSLEERLKQQARELGFALVGIANAQPADHFDRFLDWVNHGYAGEMAYLAEHTERRRDPATVLPEVRSVVMLALTYPTDVPDKGSRIAKYAHGPDYHEFIWAKLNHLRDWLQREVPGSVARGVTDSAPLLERDFARRAGLGWFGKNTMLINKHLGSFFFLAALLTSVELIVDSPHVTSHCGTCTACMDACPTQAFVQAGTLDARKCISYLTIEAKTPMPLELRLHVGDWLFGCDICQDVCPWNRHGNLLPGLPNDERIAAVDPLDILQMTKRDFRNHFKGTSLMRANWRGLVRNAAIVLGNQRVEHALPMLEQTAQTDDEMIREACMWAMEQIKRNTA